MQYLGSKRRYANRIISLIDQLAPAGIPWIEPFCGGCNSLDKVKDRPRIGCDSHPYLIALWKALQAGWIPPSNVPKEQYLAIKSSPDQYDAHLVGFVGFSCSFGSKFMDSYAKNAQGRNYAAVSARGLARQLRNLSDVRFHLCDYTQIPLETRSIIYCDPPYPKTTKYSNVAGAFDHAEFLKIARTWAELGHYVYISGYAVPSGFTEVLRLEASSSLSRVKSHRSKDELLFIPSHFDAW